MATGDKSRLLHDRILLAAAGMFALKGFDDTRMDDLSLAVGCSKGGLYHHFRSKEELFGEVVERCRNARTVQERRVLTEAWALASRSDLIRRAVQSADPGRRAPSLLEATLARGRMIQEQLMDQPFRPAALAMLFQPAPAPQDGSQHRHEVRSEP